jgi:hypothetical protein
MLAKGGTSKKRLSPHLQKVLTESNKVSRLTFQMALVLKQKRIAGSERVKRKLEFTEVKKSES